MGSGRLLCEVGGSRFISKTNLGLDKVAGESGPLQTLILVDQHLTLGASTQYTSCLPKTRLANRNILHSKLHSTNREVDSQIYPLQHWTP